MTMQNPRADTIAMWEVLNSEHPFTYTCRRTAKRTSDGENDLALKCVC